MVLSELGGKLRESLRKLQSKSTVGSEQVNELLSEIARALIEADVNVQLGEFTYIDGWGCEKDK